MTARLSTTLAVLAMTAVVGQARRYAPLEVTAIRYWSLPDVTRVAVEISGEVRLRSDHVQNPDRVFFDFLGASPMIDGHRLYTTAVGDKLLKRIRAAEYEPGVTRVVLDLEPSVEYKLSRLENPSRVIIELRSTGAALKDLPQRTAADRSEPPPDSASAGKRTAAATGNAAGTDQGTAKTAVIPNRATPQTERRPTRPIPVPVQRASVTVPPPIIADPPPIAAESSKTQIAGMNGKVVITPTSVILPLPAPPAASPPSTESSPSDAATTAKSVSARPSPKTARSASDSERSLIRALGLKINRIVIDPGHGGNDEGTVGRHGVLEKDLVLDVAKRVGKLIEQRMGSEVIYTRNDDTFVPLHSRTEMANQKKADLFLSIHANSSAHPRIGGIEVYYLNFTKSPEALDVAARENASSENSVFELRDLIQTITLNEKIEESREFASKVQGALQTFEVRYNTAAKNRGIKKAPFVVLIGASMPSVLAEVGFLSNAREETLLKRPDHRQKLAEALYQGVYRYAQSLSHFQVAQRNATE
ncbi:MAG: hypothetical protein DMG57_27665 [Acidobacteria bacterium]|nr:MAG: hypothetical protein DMG57_27665 [Acidobacteriota bacterium]